MLLDCVLFLLRLGLCLFYFHSYCLIGLLFSSYDWLGLFLILLVLLGFGERCSSDLSSTLDFLASEGYAFQFVVHDGVICGNGPSMTSVS